MRFAVPMFVAIAMIAGTLQAEIPWQTNLRSAHAEAQAKGKLMLLHFYSDNCVWCDRLEQTSFASPDVSAAIDAKFVPVKIHAGKNPKLTEMFKVTKFPTDVIVTPGGETLAHGVSPQQPARYVAMLMGAAAPKRNTPSPSSVAGTAEEVLQAKQVSARLNTPPQPPAPPAPALTDKSMPVSNATTKPSKETTKSPATSATKQTSAITATPNVSKRQPELAIQGFCPVTVIKEDRWIEGNPKLGVVHLGRLYLFANTDAMQAFLADPIPFTPVLNEIDVVRFFEEKKIVPGKREWGLKDPTHNRMFFFADEAAMNHFWNEYERYTDAAIDVMDKAIKDANPGT